MIRDDLTPEQIALLSVEGQRLAAAAANPPATGHNPPSQDEKVAGPPLQKAKARNMTLVAIRRLEIEGHVFHHGAEIMPGLLAKEVVDKLIDQQRVREYDASDRRSLHRLFAAFSDCKEREQLTNAELTEFALSH